MTTIKLTRVLAVVLSLPLFAGCQSDDGADAGPVSYTLRVIVPGGGSVTSSDPRIVNCTGTCSATFPEGTVVLLTATAAQGATFQGWAGGACNGTDPSCTVVMTKDQEEVAIFSTTVAGGIGAAFGLTATNNLFSFNPDTSGGPIPVLSNALVSGLDANDQLVGIDFRPANGLLYGLAKNGTTGKLYLINKSTTPPTAVKVSTLSAALNGTDFAVDFDPYNDWLRVISNSGQTLHITPDDSGTTIVDSSNGNPGLTGAAYNNNFTGTADSTLYVINTNFTPAKLQRLIQTPPTSRVNGPDLNVTVSAANGFDIDARTDTAYMVYKTPSSTDTQFGIVNLSDGTVTAQALGIAGADVRGLAIPTPGVPEVFGIKSVLDQQGTLTGHRLVKFGPLTPDSITEIGTITDSGQNIVGIVGIDFRPSNGKLYALSYTDQGDGTGLGQLYTLNTTTGEATAVGTGLGVTLNEADVFGLDFDPVADSIVSGPKLSLRIVSTANQNLRVNSDTGLAVQPLDTPLERPLIEPTGVAFNNSQQTTAPGQTTMYVIDTEEGRLGTVETSGSNAGRFTPLGKLVGISDFSDLNGFEIIGRTDTNPDPNITTSDQVALAAFASGGQSVLYRINLDADPGAVALVGAIPALVVGITARPQPNPSVNTNQDLFAITESGRLIAFSRSAPFSPRTICTGSEAGMGGTFLGLDFRPAGGTSQNPGTLYALTDTGTAMRLIVIDTINVVTGAETCMVSALSRDLVNDNGTLDGKKLEMDFDAASGLLHITTDQRDHLIVDPATGVVTTQADIVERTPFVGAAAYTSAGTLYDINLDTGSTGDEATGTNGTLMTQDGNDGTLHDVGVLFPDPSDPHAIDGSISPVMSLDIFGPNSSLALAVLRERFEPANTTEEKFTRLYKVDLTTGQLTEIIVDDGVDGNDDGGIGPRSGFEPTEPSDPRETRINVTDITIRFPPSP